MKYAIPLILLVCGVGCDSIQYRGTSADVRTFSDDPRPDQYYLGLNFEFAVVDPPDDASKAKKRKAATEPKVAKDGDVIPRPLPGSGVE